MSAIRTTKGPKFPSWASRAWLMSFIIRKNTAALCSRGPQARPCGCNNLNPFSRLHVGNWVSSGEIRDFLYVTVNYGLPPAAGACLPRDFDEGKGWPWSLLAPTCFGDLLSSTGIRGRGDQRG